MARLILYAFLACAFTPTARALSLKDARHNAHRHLQWHARDFLSKSSDSSSTSEVHNPIRVACAGASITHGFDAPGDKYPVILQHLLGDGYNVTNLGAIGKVVQKEGVSDWPYPYWQTEQFSALTRPNEWDIVVVMLGTSDASEDPPYWNHEACDAETPSFQCKFWVDYNDLIREVQKAGSPEIFIAVPPPVTAEEPFQINATVVNSIFPILIPKLAKANGIRDDHVIDLFNGMGGGSIHDVPEGGCTPYMEKPTVCSYFCDEHFCDHVHPNLAGKQKLAELVADAIKSESSVVYWSQRPVVS